MSYFLKENFMLVSLFVGLIGVLVAVLSLIAELRTRKNKYEQ